VIYEQPAPYSIDEWTMNSWIQLFDRPSSGGGHRINMVSFENDVELVMAGSFFRRTKRGSRQFDQPELLPKKRNATFLYTQGKQGDDKRQKSLPCSVDSMDSISIDQALSMIRKRLDDMSDKFGGKLYSPDMKKLRLKVVPSDLIKSSKRFVGKLNQLFPDYMMGAEPLDESGYNVIDGVSSCVFETTSGGFFAVFAVKSSSHARFEKYGCCNDFSMVCEYDSKGPEDQPLFFMGVPLRICAGCRQTVEKSYKCSVCRCAGLHVRYCSKVCQVKHWPMHKTVCGAHD
jgi:hypothetical protein